MVDVEATRAALESARTAIATQIQSLERDLAETVYAQRDGGVRFDEDSSEGEGLIVEADRLRALLRAEREALAACNDALERLARGTYGTCVGCGQVIAAERLVVLPFTDLCVGCKAKS